MGLPGFFAWLLRKYKESKEHKMIIPKLKNRPERLYIDANCAFHPQCFKLLGYYESREEKISNETLENKMIDRIINYIEFLVKYVNPTELVYISVDGVAPLAKIKQQRMRRFRSVEDTQIRKEIKNKHKIKIHNEWSNTVITPGTVFMENLHREINKYLKNKSKTIKYIYSSYHTPGEGEHKILQHIKSTKKENNAYVIYGLDADLFFLAMASGMKNLYLLRETAQFENHKEEKKIEDPIKDVEEDLKYVSIDITKEMYYEQIVSLIKRKAEETGKEYDESDLNQERFCDDFILICYFLGNDFLPHLPSIDIKNGGLDTILDSYSEIYLDNNKYIVTNKNKELEIEDELMIELITHLGTKEYNYFTYILPKHKERLEKRKCEEKDSYKMELWELENLKNIEKYDPVKLGVDNEEMWKFRYYNHYFNTIENMNKTIGEICKNYLEGIKWVANYYFRECEDWTWQYNYSHGPFLSDLGEYYYESKICLNKIKFKIKEPLTPCSQLLAVLPPQCYELLPKSYQELVLNIHSPIYDLFPLKVEIDTINKDQLWQCIPLVPIVDSKRIVDTINKSKIILTKEEKKRNENITDLVY
jgi:5'-3' exonuclease